MQLNEEVDDENYSTIIPNQVSHVFEQLNNKIFVI